MLQGLVASICEWALQGECSQARHVPGGVVRTGLLALVVVQELAHGLPQRRCIGGQCRPVDFVHWDGPFRDTWI